MTLEKKLVLEEMTNGKNNQYILDKAEALIDLDVNLDLNKVKEEIKRYKQIQKYSKKENNKSSVKKRVRKKAIDYTERLIKKIEEDSEVCSIKIKDRKADRNKGPYKKCNNCSTKLRYKQAEITRIKKEEGAERFLKEKEYATLFTYCIGCGILNNGPYVFGSEKIEYSINKNNNL